VRFSTLFAPTTKDAPKDAVLPSHTYLVRGGFVSQVGAGIYNFLPLGKMVLDKIRVIVKEELDKSGCQEVQLGFVTPSELWKESGRYSQFGKELLRFSDRKNNEFVLGPTHEEAMVDLVRNRIKSYKQLPLNLYQINTKFRDEARPRYGLLRGREFLMKDGYSFHENVEDLEREYALMESTYSRILERLGLDFRVVEADSGAIGGSGSRELMVLADNGEDDIVVCSACEYAANIEAATAKERVPTSSDVEMQAGEFHTPNISTIEELSAFFKIDTSHLVKAVAKKAIYEDCTEIVLFFLRGCDELQDVKAQNACAALELEDVSVEELEKARIVVGFIGPEIQGVACYHDSRLKDAQMLICGANKKDYHDIGYSYAQKDVDYHDIVSVKAGDSCIVCAKPLEITKGIEVGHIFQLGTKYSDALGATFLDRDGKTQPFVMGTYGLGLSRLVAVMIEQHHDEKGCLWTPSTTPFMFDIVISNHKDEAQVAFATELYEKMQDAGLSVLLDDRKERFGFKMGDFELLGFPYAIIVGKGLKEGEVQLVTRASLEKETLSTDVVFEKVKSL
jgi:prolyl-tRNA synthetase